MILTPDRLSGYLEQQPIRPGYLVFGDEPLQVMESVDRIRAAAKQAGASERLVLEVDRSFNWDSLASAISGMSLFSDRRLVEVRLGERKPDKNGSALLTELLSAPVSEDVLVVTAGKLDRNRQKAKWFKAFEQHGAVVQARQLAARQLERWISARGQQLGLTIERAAADLIATRAEGNMLAAAQEVDKLSLLSDGETITVDVAIKVIADSARYDVFKLVDSALAGHPSVVIRMLRGLREEGVEAVVVNWALNRELRAVAAMSAEVAEGKPVGRAVSDAGVWRSRSAMTEATLGRASAKRLKKLFLDTIRIDRMIKGSLPGNPWDEMELVCLRWAR